jgi:hypothetical protein
MLLGLIGQVKAAPNYNQTNWSRQLYEQLNEAYQTSLLLQQMGAYDCSGKSYTNPDGSCITIGQQQALMIVFANQMFDAWNTFNTIYVGATQSTAHYACFPQAATLNSVIRGLLLPFATALYPGFLGSLELDTFVVLDVVYSLPAVETNPNCKCRCGAANPHAPLAAFYNVQPMADRVANCS